ncbi:hypothetical protein LCGC14_2547900, partial [marine sediment metagenome]
MANPQVATVPATEPVTLDEVKRRLRIEITNSDDDDLLNDLTQAARARAEAFLNRRLVTQTLDFFVDAFPATDFIELPGGRLASITSLKYTDSDNLETTWTATNYFASITAEPGRLHLAFNISWPTATLKPRDAVVVRYVVGYGAAAAVPFGIRAGMMLAIGHLFHNRSDVVIQQGVTAIEIPQAA